MRIPVNYGEVNVKNRQIRVGVSLMSRIIGTAMLTIVLVLITFIIMIGGGPVIFSTSSAQLWVLSGLIIYFGLRFMGAWSDSQVIDGNRKEISVNKHWLFLPYNKRVYPFKDVRSIICREVVNRKVGAKQLDTSSLQILFLMKDNAWLTVASISLANPDETQNKAEQLTNIISELVGCPVNTREKTEVI